MNAAHSRVTARRDFLRSAALLLAGMTTMRGQSGIRAIANDPNRIWRMPDESEPHRCTWMAFGASATIWGRRLLPRVRRDLALLATTIAKYEPVRMLVRHDEIKLARDLLGGNARIELIPCPLDDLWIRDTGPTFVRDAEGGKRAVDFNFNGWGRKQRYTRDAKVATAVSTRAGIARIRAPLVMEGGCIEVDGHGTAIVTESCTLNDNRNPGMSKAQFEDRLMPLLGLDKIIWLPGIRGRDITDGHTDFYARFARPGVVLAGLESDPDIYDHEVTQRHLEILRASTDARGHRLEVVALESPQTIRPQWESDDFAAGYIGFYVCNGAVIAQEFGDPDADARARAALNRAFPGRTIEMLNIDGIAAGGGSIHCATQQEPA
jgi:agmatine deiminase